jgi:hypothetical protein
MNLTVHSCCYVASSRTALKSRNPVLLWHPSVFTELSPSNGLHNPTVSAATVWHHCCASHSNRVNTSLHWCTMMSLRMGGNLFSEPALEAGYIRSFHCWVTQQPTANQESVFAVTCLPSRCLATCWHVTILTLHHSVLMIITSQKHGLWHNFQLCLSQPFTCFVFYSYLTNKMPTLSIFS